MKKIKLLVVLLSCTNLLFSFYCDAQSQNPLNKLVLKGTHNSYACCGDGSNSCPVVHDEPYKQIDNWNVWCVELDFSVDVENINGVSTPIFYIGHDGKNGNDATWTENENVQPFWGKTLNEFLLKIKQSKSLSYRPIIIRLEKKNNWGNANYKDFNNWRPLLQNMLIAIFERENIFGPKALSDNNNVWKTVPELAGKIIPIIECVSDDDNCTPNETDLLFTAEKLRTASDPMGLGGGPLKRWAKDDYTNESEYIANSSSGNYTIISADQYQNDWTFNKYLAPPNPVYVVAGAKEVVPVINTYGRTCFNDPFNKGLTFNVLQHGTYQFPYDKVGESVEKALPGWTILMKAGNYNEKNLKISKTLTLKADGGTVVIGR